jgi:hypothetical protein
MSLLSRISLVCLIGIAVLLVACGGGSGVTDTQLTQAQATTVASAVTYGLAMSLSDAITSLPAFTTSKPSTITMANALRSHKSAGSVEGTPAAPLAQSNPVSCNGSMCTVDYTYTCSGGGTTSISGSATDSVNSSSGNGAIGLNVRLTPNKCDLTEFQITMDGKPNVSLAFNANFSNFNPTFPLTVTEKGAIAFGPDSTNSPIPSGTCNINLSYSVDANNCSITGTMCGQTINTNCI